MSERDGFEHGVPCWVDTWQPDAEAAFRFYTRLFGWDPEDTMPADVPGQHFMCRLRGRDVAAIASRPQAARRAPGRATRQRAGGMVDERSQHPRSRGGDVVLWRAVRLGDRDLRPGRRPDDDVEAPGLRGWRAAAAGRPRRGRDDDSPSGDQAEAPASWSVDFWIWNVDQAVREATELGGKVITGPYDIPDVGMRQAVIADPQGATLSLTQPPGIG